MFRMPRELGARVVVLWRKPLWRNAYSLRIGGLQPGDNGGRTKESNESFHFRPENGGDDVT